MNNEIKEILDYFRKYATIRENTMISEIEDYITNLQQEKEDYKSRIEKAAKYIKKHILKYDIDGFIGDFDEFDILISPSDLLDMLQNGGDKDE